jgi:LysR family transcriptional regulator, benzoate and cis,cis-muconate-responsive activator of ben and cat genes
MFLPYASGMELRHLRYFLAVARNLSFVKAAETLHISQPPLSRQIQDFEKEIGTPLFDRSSHGTALTRAGEYLMVEVERCLERLESACESARRIGNAAPGSLKIGCVSFLLYSVLPPLLEKFQVLRPEVKLEILVMSTEEQEAALRSGAIDLGFVRSWIREEGLVFEPLMEEKLAIIYPAGRSESSDAASCLASLAGSSFVTVSSAVAPGLTERLLSICASYDCVPTIGYESNDSYSIVKLVAAGLGWSIVPDLELDEAAVAGVGSLPLTQTMILGLAYRKSVVLEHEVAFIRLAEAYFFEKSSREAGSS